MSFGCSTAPHPLCQPPPPPPLAVWCVRPEIGIDVITLLFPFFFVPSHTLHRERAGKDNNLTTTMIACQSTLYQSKTLQSMIDAIISQQRSWPSATRVGSSTPFLPCPTTSTMWISNRLPFSMWIYANPGLSFSVVKGPDAKLASKWCMVRNVPVFMKWTKHLLTEIGSLKIGDLWEWKKMVFLQWP